MAGPEHSKPYCAKRKTPKFEKTELDSMLNQSISEPAQTEWVASIVCALRKDGTLSFCVNYHKLNAVTKPDFFPKPRKDE